MTEKAYRQASRLKNERVRFEVLLSVLKDTKRIKFITKETEYTYSQSEKCDYERVNNPESEITKLLLETSTKAVEARLAEIEKEFADL